MLSQTLKKIPVVYEFVQNLFHLRHEVAFIRKRHLVSYLWMNDISGPAEVRDHRDGASRESFKDYARAEVANRWKHQHIRGSQAPKDLRMANPTTEGNSLLDLKGSRKLLKAVPFRTISEHGEASQTASQEGSSRAQRQIASLCRESAPRRRSTQVLAPGSVLRESPEHREATDAVLRDKKQSCRDTRQTRHMFGTKRL